MDVLYLVYWRIIFFFFGGMFYCFDVMVDVGVCEVKCVSDD